MTSHSSVKSFILFGLAAAALLAVVVIGIELARRPITPPGALTDVPAESAFKPFPRELTDAAGETLVIPEPPRRIVSQTLGTDEILLSICPTDFIVALSDLAEDPNYSNVVEQAEGIPGRTTQGAEQILQLNPDLVFVASYSRAETVEILKKTGAPVFRFANFTSIEDIKNNIKTVGYATGCDAKAEVIVKQMTEELTAISDRIPKLDRPVRVMSYGGGYTAGSGTLFDDMVRAVGAVNVSVENNLEGFAKISGEKLAEWQPDFIVAGANTADRENKRQQLLVDPVIASTKAGKEGKVIVIDNRYYLAVSHFVTKAVEDLFDGIYGAANDK